METIDDIKCGVVAICEELCEDLPHDTESVKPEAWGELADELEEIALRVHLNRIRIAAYSWYCRGQAGNED